MYAQCCAPYHEGANPPDARALMRARYSAYALGNSDYIIATTHPDHPDSSLPLVQRERQIKTFCQNTVFEGLEILEVENRPPHATVTFKAHLTQQGRDASYIEKSAFAQVGGRWLYLSPVTIEKIC
jgi:SEC-C motif domain protein